MFAHRLLLVVCTDRQIHFHPLGTPEKEKQREILNTHPNLACLSPPPLSLLSELFSPHFLSVSGFLPSHILNVGCCKTACLPTVFSSSVCVISTFLTFSSSSPLPPFLTALFSSRPFFPPLSCILSDLCIDIHLGQVISEERERYKCKMQQIECKKHLVANPSWCVCEKLKAPLRPINNKSLRSVDLTRSLHSSSSSSSSPLSLTCNELGGGYEECDRAHDTRGKSPKRRAMFLFVCFSSPSDQPRVYPLPLRLARLRSGLLFFP